MKWSDDTEKLVLGYKNRYGIVSILVSMFRGGTSEGLL
jgi:hypothetical protein